MSLVTLSSSLIVVSMTKQYIAVNTTLENSFSIFIGNVSFDADLRYLSEIKWGG